MRIRKQHIFIGITAILITFGMGLYHSAYAAGVLAGSSRTVTRDLIVNGTAEASIKITPVSTLLEGKYTGLSRQTVATYEATVSGGTLAIRFNPTVGKEYGNPRPTLRTLINNANSANTMGVALDDSPENSQVIDSWLVFPEGTTSHIGKIRTLNNETIVGGVYPVAIDAVAWLF